MLILGYIIVAVVAYFLGSIPTGYLVGKAKGIDIRTTGSGNMGATNVFRVLGKGPGIFVLLVDALKGYLAAAIVLHGYSTLHHLSPHLFGIDGNPDDHLRENLAITAGICAVLGHNYTCWLKFKGGKGIATTAGVYLALAPGAVGIAIAAWIIALAITRYVSIASITAAIALPTAVWFMNPSLLLATVTTALGLLAIAKHKENIKRLMSGTERRFGSKPPQQEAPK